jgi:hypothetical protein
MEVSVMKNVIERALDTAPVPLFFRLAPRSGAWLLTEESKGEMGGIFSSILTAIAFVRTEARKKPGTKILIELCENQALSA